MTDGYIFRPILAEEIGEMFRLIQRRMKWMDEKGIRQWNVTGYDTVYPPAYYEAHRQAGEVFVLTPADSDQILCAAVLRREDERWLDIPGSMESPAVYLHNFVSRLGAAGAGSVFLERAEQYARKKGCTYFRLDSAIDNQGLTRYYSARGYVPVGNCTDGPYTGILREKKLH